MRSVLVLTHHAPAFLKAAYRPDTDLIDHERHIPARARFVSWEADHDRPWRVWRMTRERVPIPLGRFPDIGAALCAARR